MLCREPSTSLQVQGCTDAWLTLSIHSAKCGVFFSVIEGFITISAALCVCQTLKFLLRSIAALSQLWAVFCPLFLPFWVCSTPRLYLFPWICSSLCAGQSHLRCLSCAIWINALNINITSCLQWYFFYTWKIW